MSTRCLNCDRGREACEWCENLSAQDWEAICDCGLYDFGSHLLDCTARATFLYVVAQDYTSAHLPRPVK